MKFSVNNIRQAFLDFFAGKGHEIVPSSPLVPHNDPTLMFTNAGMVPFKDVFTEKESRPYTRATSSQKCVRAGGKHNDLDNVGYTARHHTFFEMLGNFSFGDYFKKEAISYAWEFLTEVLQLPKDKLYVTIYHTDEEAYGIWKNDIGLTDDRIIRIATNDNFWAMGPVGPCGPCSEIFFDHGADIPGGLPGTPEEDGDRYIEIWNLVFMQYEQLENGDRINLPNPCIDTGMGLERIAAVLQHVHNNYETDLFANIIAASQALTKNDDSAHLVSHRVIADHLRSIAFLLADGVMPSNEGRGYVLRRIMRRAMRHARQLGCKNPVIYALVPALIKEMGEAYPQLVRAQKLIEEMLLLEEKRFGETLDRGLKILDESCADLTAGSVVSGDIAFKLYDTYGFPYDLTVDILRGRDISVDEAGFNAAMQEQKTRARAAWKGSGETATSDIWYELKESHGATEFLGYDAASAQAKILTLIDKNGASISHASQGDTVQILLNQTPFYGESGGQEGDHGKVTTESGAVVEITNTAKYLGSLHVHIGKVTQGNINENDVATAAIDVTRRNHIRANHSATHLLHAVLRDVLGDHVTQKGSLVTAERLRFDISHPKAISDKEIERIEAAVNALIRQNTAVNTRLMTPDEAIETGAVALFGEKYGDEVRVLNMGVSETGADYSVELCGGTHVKHTGDIAVFKLISEGAVAAGIRRIEAMTGETAMRYIREKEQTLMRIAARLKTSPDQAESRVEALLEERKALEKSLAEAKKAAALGNGAATKIEKIGNIEYLGHYFSDVPAKDLRGIAGDLLAQIASGVVAASSSYEGKAALIIAVTDDQTVHYNAVELVKSASELLGAKGAGGKPGFAQTGGSHGDKAEEAIAKIKAALSK
jgi:alanyl-tRNA synthetase